MEHAEFRRLFGANPKRTEPEVLEHRASCPECAKYAADMQRIDQMLLGALDVPAPKAGPKPWDVERRVALARVCAAQACWCVMVAGGYVAGYGSAATR